MSDYTPGPWEATIQTGPECGCRVLVHHIPPGQAAEILTCPLHRAAPLLLARLRAILEGMEASGGWEGDDELFEAGMEAVRMAEGEK